MEVLVTILAMVPFYLIGSFPTGYLIATAKGIDIKSQGSGNVGATNVGRIIGKKAGIFTLVGDVGKGYLGMWLATLIFSQPHMQALCAFALVAGHCISLPPKLKGGKGVATALGVYLFASPVSAAVGAVVFAAVISFSGIVSLASVLSAVAIPITALLLGVNNEMLYAFFGISLLIIFRHKDNLLRLVEGNEKKISFQK